MLSRSSAARWSSEVTVRFKFRPVDDSFYEFFTRAASNLVKGTELLSGLAVGLLLLPLTGAGPGGPPVRRRRAVRRAAAGTPAGTGRRLSLPLAGRAARGRALGR